MNSLANAAASHGQLAAILPARAQQATSSSCAPPPPFWPQHRRLGGRRLRFVAKSAADARAHTARTLPQLAALASRDDMSSSLDDAEPDLAEADLIRAVQQIEVEEPAAEQRAESAAAAVAAAFAFGAGVWAVLGRTKGEEYFAGYLLEQSLSIDNLFVFILVFKYFKTPVELQRTVLTYGIATAAVLRLVLIVAGVEIVASWKPVLLFFAGILLFSSYKLLTEGDSEEDDDLADNPIIKFCRSLFQFSDDYDGDKFFTTLASGARAATPLLLVLLVVELSDVVFAVDSIPAVFGVTLDPFIVYTSNIFAILSLRGLYSFVAEFMAKLHYLEKAVALVLGFIGVKIIAEFGGVVIPTSASLAVVATVLSAGVGASLLLPEAADKGE